MKLFRKSAQPKFLNEIADVFSHRVKSYGGTPAGVLWKNSEGQQLRFEVLAGIIDELAGQKSLSVNDFGCGYAALFEFLNELSLTSELSYYGYDISSDMIGVARKRVTDRRAVFMQSAIIENPADVTFVSGTYNLSLDVADKHWNAYIKESLAGLWKMSRKGLAFNMLDKNHPNQGDGLYVADSAEFMDFCRKFSTNVTLVDDYPLHEWTIFVRRD